MYIQNNLEPKQASAVTVPKEYRNPKNIHTHVIVAITHPYVKQSTHSHTHPYEYEYNYHQSQSRGETEGNVSGNEIKRSGRNT